MKFDKNGVLLADVAPSGVARIDPNAKSGNAAHDTRSGKFAPKGGKPKSRTTPPPNVARGDYARMLDAVREAARSFAGNLTEENLMSWLAKRAKNPAAVNVQQFFQAVQQQQLDDLVDVVDSEARNKSGVKVQAPRGYVKKVLAGVSDDDIGEIIQRLQARGVKDPHLIIAKNLDKERKDFAQPVEASEPIDFEAVQLSDEPENENIQITVAPPEQPVIEVRPEITIQTPSVAMKVTPVRDESGMILYTLQEPVTDAS